MTGDARRNRCRQNEYRLIHSMKWMAKWPIQKPLIFRPPLAGWKICARFFSERMRSRTCPNFPLLGPWTAVFWHGGCARGGDVAGVFDERSVKAEVVGICKFSQRGEGLVRRLCPRCLYFHRRFGDRARLRRKRRLCFVRCTADVKALLHRIR